MRWAIFAMLALLGGCGPRTFTVCADPDNMPFSNRRGEGLENKLAELLAKDMSAKLRYEWWSQRRGWIRETLKSGKCDAWMGVPSNLEALATSRPYYRSSYVFVTRADANLVGLTLDDPRLRGLSIGVQLAGDDGANPPPADALARRGLIEQVRGYMLTDPAEPIGAVARGELDLAVAWGPTAGWHAERTGLPLRSEPVTPWMDQGRWPMVFDISVGVAKENQKLRREIDISLNRNRPAVDRIVEEFDVPLAPGG